MFISFLYIFFGRLARKIYRKEINILRKIVQQVGFIYKIIVFISHWYITSQRFRVLESVIFVSG